MKYKFQFNLCILLILGLTFSNCQYKKPVSEANEGLLSIYIDSLSYYKINLKRQQALDIGFLETESDDYVPALIRFSGKKNTGEIRLKGDRLDHLNTSRWSFRIKLDSSYFLGMERFSIHRPETRSNLDEWLFHEVLHTEDILTTDYTFINVEINGDNKGAYAVEEHFDKNLLEKQNRREGPILKFSEDGFWKTQIFMNDQEKDPKHFVPVFETAPIEAFQDGRTLDNSHLRKMYLKATTNLENWRYGKGELSEIINFEKYAKFFALTDLMQGYHALRWHNLRFYYNPMDGLIEPIVYDSYTAEGVYRWFNKTLIGEYSDKKNICYYREEFLIYQLFNYPEFRKKYLTYLEKFSSEKYINSIISHSTNKMAKLKSSFPTVPSNIIDINSRAVKLRQYIREYGQKKHIPFEYRPFLANYDPCQISTPIDKVSLVVHPVEGVPTNVIQVYNYHCQDLYIIGSGPKKKNPEFIFDQPVQLTKSFITSLPPLPEIIELPKKHDWLFYKTEPGSTQIYKVKVSDWPRLDKNNLDTAISEFPASWLQIQGDTAFLKQGTYDLDRLYTYTKATHFKILPNTIIKLSAGGGIIFKCPVTINGGENKTIKIYSNSPESAGFNIINANEMSTIRGVEFDNLYPLQKNGIYATGGIHIVNSPVNISGCRFSNFHCEDALNIVSADSIIIQDTHFENCQSDALDIDFGNSLISNVSYSGIKGDGIDLSGGKSKLTNIELTDVSDKGISMGENARTELNNILIKDSSIGIAFKEGVEAIGSGLKISDCEYGILVFRKKKLFRTAKVTLDDFQCNNNCIQVELNHQVIINGEKITSNFEDGYFSKILY